VRKYFFARLHLFTLSTSFYRFRSLRRISISCALAQQYSETEAVNGKERGAKMDHSDIATWPGRTEAARLIGFSSEIIGLWMHQGKLRFFQTRIGRLVDPADLQRLGRERAASSKGATAK
jgi:hypothetical protein